MTYKQLKTNCIHISQLTVQVDARPMDPWTYGLDSWGRRTCGFLGMIDLCVLGVIDLWVLGDDVPVGSWG